MTHCLRYSLLRARLFGSRPGGGFPNAAIALGPPVEVHDAHVGPLLEGPLEAPPLDILSGGRGESIRNVNH